MGLLVRVAGKGTWGLLPPVTIETHAQEITQLRTEISKHKRTIKRLEEGQKQGPEEASARPLMPKN